MEIGRRTHGGIRLMSVLEPQPGHVGFFKVVSTIVQLSPFKPQFPGQEGISQSIPKTDAQRWYLTGLKIAICHSGRSAKELAFPSLDRNSRNSSEERSIRIIRRSTREDIPILDQGGSTTSAP